MATARQTRDLDFELGLPMFPAADRPAEEYRGARDDVKLLVMNRERGAFDDASFADLPMFLRPGDVLVVNTSQTIPARLPAMYLGRPLYLHLAARLSEHEAIVERRTALGGPDESPFPVGTQVLVGEPGSINAHTTVTVVRKFHPNSRLWVVHSEVDLYTLAQAIGEPITYHYLSGKPVRAAYETIFAHHPGSSEMPSASRPFTRPLLRRLAKAGVRVACLTLHTTVSSHEVTSTLAEHPIVPEWYRIPPRTADLVRRTKATGGRVIAVGTTVVRALEASAEAKGTVSAGETWTDYLVTPDYPLRVVDGLVTGMHDNHSSHLALMDAFIPRETLVAAYAYAANHGYLWHEFGDLSLVL